MAKHQALGKGIGALLTSASQDGNRKYFLCPIEDLRPHHKQPRKSFNDNKLRELADSIREKGIIQPLVVRRGEDHYQIIAGERRWRAAQKAGLKEVPVVIQDVTEDWALEMALIENIQREDLNPIEEAEAYRNLVEDFDLTQDEVSKRVGKDRSTITNSLRLLRLPGKVREDVMSGRLSMGHARSLLGLEDEDDILEARSQVVAKKLSVRETESLIKKIKSFGLSHKPKPKAKQELPPEVADLENRLKQAIGTQVRFLPKGKGGKIEIAYYSPEDLDRLLNILGVS